MPKGFYTGYSYCGIMPDGRKAYFANDREYVEAYEEEAKEHKPFLFVAIISMVLIELEIILASRTSLADLSVGKQRVLSSRQMMLVGRGVSSYINETSCAQEPLRLGQ